MAKASVTNIKPRIAKAKRDLKREAAYVVKLWLSLPEPERTERYRAIMATGRTRGEKTATVLLLAKGAAHG
jgi:hypothetical protein